MTKLLMMMTMKAAVFAAAFALLAPVAPEAAAYRQVCVHFKAGVGFAGSFRVEYGVVRYDAFWVPNAHKRFKERSLNGPFWPGDLVDARGRTDWSRTVTVFRTECVQMDEVRTGEHFLVLLRSHAGGLSNYRYCRGWGRDHKPAVFNASASRRHMTMNLHAWGAATTLECRPVSFG